MIFEQLLCNYFRRRERSFPSFEKEKFKIYDSSPEWEQWCSGLQLRCSWTTLVSVGNGSLGKLFPLITSNNFLFHSLFVTASKSCNKSLAESSLTECNQTSCAMNYAWNMLDDVHEEPNAARSQSKWTVMYASWREREKERIEPQTAVCLLAMTQFMNIFHIPPLIRATRGLHTFARSTDGRAKEKSRFRNPFPPENARSKLSFINIKQRPWSTKVKMKVSSWTASARTSTQRIQLITPHAIIIMVSVTASSCSFCRQPFGRID